MKSDFATRVARHPDRLIAVLCLTVISAINPSLGTISSLLYLFWLRRGLIYVFMSFLLFGSVFFILEQFISWRISHALSNTLLVVVAIYFPPSQIKQIHGTAKSKFDSVSIWILAGISVVTLLRGKTYVLNSLLSGYDNVGHFSMMKTISECQGYLSECELTGIATPDGYRFYPQYFHYVFSPFISAFGEQHQLSMYYAISMAIYLCTLNFAFKALGSIEEKFDSHLKGTFSKKGKLKKTLLNPQKNLQSAKSTGLIFKVTILLLVTYIHGLGYLNYEFAILCLLAWLLVFKHISGKKDLLYVLLLFMASSSIYPLVLPPSLALMCYLVFQARAKVSNAFLIIYSISVFLYSTLVILSNIKTNAKYATTAGGNIFLIIFIVSILIALIWDKFGLRNSTEKKWWEFEPITFMLIIYSVYSLSLYVFNISSGERMGYYTQKMSLIAILLSIPQLLYFLAKSNYLESIRNQLGLKISIWLIGMASLAGLSTIPYINAAKQQLAILYNPMIYLSKIATFDASSSPQSERILKAAVFKPEIVEPLLIRSVTGPQDTIWANALRSSWSTDLESSLQKGVLNINDPKIPILGSKQEGFEVSIWNYGER
jgi:hypothetical protein